jgi:hypothetical protein
MADPLQNFRDVMLVSTISSVILGLVLLLLTRWRAYWSRLLDAEGNFWKRYGIVGKWAAPLRRIEESRLAVYAVAGLLALHVLLLMFAAGAYLHFAPKVRKAAEIHPILEPSPAPTKPAPQAAPQTAPQPSPAAKPAPPAKSGSPAKPAKTAKPGS